METRLHLTADFEPLPVYEPHSSAALPTTQESSRDERSQSLEQVKKVVGIQKEPTGMRFTECDIFRHAITDWYQTLLIKKLRALHAQEYTVPFSTSPPDVESLTQQCLSWILSEGASHQETNFVSQLTSHILAQALEGTLDGETISTFQDFVLSTTLAYTAWRDQRSPTSRLPLHDLYRTSYLTGSSLLRKLDHHLGPETLHKAPRPTIQALFLVLFGTILGVTYTTHVGGRPSTDSDDSEDVIGRVLTESPTLFITMKEQLCHLLADRLVLVAELLWAKVDAAATRRCVIDGCLMGRWNRSGRWVWGNLMPHYAWPTRNHPLDLVVRRPGGTFQPAPRAAAMRCPEVLNPLLPSMDASDRGKRRSMLVVGPTTHGQQMYARMRTHTGSDGPSLFV